MSFARVVFDIETDGLLPGQTEPEFVMTHTHCMSIKCLDTDMRASFVNNDERDDIVTGIEILEAAELVSGHNIINFDIEALRLEFPDLNIRGKILDTLVMSRMVFADIKDGDFRLSAKGQLPGQLIGTHGLESWGYRLGLNKGDYKKEREEQLKEMHKAMGLPPPTDLELHRHVWGTWNPAMHEYMELDVDVNVLLFNKIAEMQWSPEATTLEHQIHALMVQQEINGFKFNVPKARKLEEELRREYDAYAASAIETIGQWYRPEKRRIDEVFSALGEHGERRVWGEVTTPKRTASYKKSNADMIAAGDLTKLRADAYEGVPYVKVEVQDFNPNSRPQIIDRLQVLYGWEPQDFTEKGSAKVDDEILRALASDIPLAETLADVFYMKKRLGQVADGQNGWLKLVQPDGRIHGRVNVGGAVSGRATHAKPNVSQVPGVEPVEIKGEEAGKAYLLAHAELVNAWGAPIIVKSKWKAAKDQWDIIVRGRAAGYGYDCRELFEVAHGFKLVGCDLSGIEFRCLANLTHPFDNGEIMDVVLNGDIHQKNADLTGIARGLAKRLLYACMYGGGDAKLGSIIEPFSSEARQKTLGAQARVKLMRAMPSLDRAIKEIKREKRKHSGTIRGLDGRRLYVRSDHAALNLRLQSDGALIAKKWCLLIDDLFENEGWEHHVEGEYAFCSWSHDEVQISVREELAERAATLMEAAAPMAGDHFKFICPVAAEAKIGMNWAETH